MRKVEPNLNKTSRGIVKKIFSRATLFSLLFLVQVAIVVSFAIFFAQYYVIYYWIDFIIRIVALMILAIRNSSPFFLLFCIANILVYNNKERSFL